ncbi:MAG: calcium/sodium antiporter [Acholeplasmatales bacterium]|jgi:cation:H+ antiporter|nr:calcium/sodium antiporter [Acholeplasmatales bacterium]
MDYFLYSLALIGGLIILIKGADFVVDSSSTICKRLKISPIIIGLTVLAIGTSLPELSVSINSVLQGESEIALGNIIGSNISNIALIYGISLIMVPVVFNSQDNVLESIFFLASTLGLLFFFIFFGENFQLMRIEGIILFLGFIAYMVLLIIKEKKKMNKLKKFPLLEEVNNPPSQELVDPANNTPASPQKKALPFYLVIILLFVGLIAVIGGGILVTNGASFLADKLLVGVFKVEPAFSKTFIGLTVVALGTSLPELITTIVACRKKEPELGFGNIVGSNIANILLILGLSATIQPLSISFYLVIDAIILSVLSVGFYLLFRFKKSLGKKTGFLLLGFFLFYYVYLFLKTFGVIKF